MEQSRLNILKNLYNIFGLGKSKINKSYHFSGINTKIYPKHIKKKQEKKILKELNFLFLSSSLKKYISDRISFYFEIKSVKGFRFHNKNLKKKKLPIKIK